MRRNKQLLIVALFLFCGFTAAQNSTPTPTGRFPLVIEVVFNPDWPPQYQPLPDGSGFMYFRFVRIKGWRQPAGGRTVMSVYVTSTVENESVTVRVAVLYGQSGDSGTLLGAFPARENETLVVEDLKKFGIEPFKITLVRPTPPVPVSPKLENRTQALDILNVEPERTSLPSYQLTMRNVSAKNISAVMIGVVLEGANVGGAFLQGEDGRPLIAPGNSHVAVNLLAIKPELTPGGYAPSPPRSVALIISSAVFDDGTFEGDAGPATMFQSLVLGRKTFIRPFLSLVEQELKEADNEQPDAVQRFREKLNSLQFPFDDRDVKKAVAQITNNQNPQSVAEGHIRYLKRQVLGDLESLSSTQVTPRPTFKSWLESLRDRYAGWFARL